MPTHLVIDFFQQMLKCLPIVVNGDDNSQSKVVENLWDCHLCCPYTSMLLVSIRRGLLIALLACGDILAQGSLLGRQSHLAEPHHYVNVSDQWMPNN